MKKKFTPSSPMMSDSLFEFHHLYDESPLNINPHNHSFYEIFFFLSGDVNYTIEDRHYRLRPGDLLLMQIGYARADINPCKPYERIVGCLTEDWFEQMENFFHYDALDSIKDDITENQKVNRLIAFINDNLTEDLSLDYPANGLWHVTCCKTARPL